MGKFTRIAIALGIGIAGTLALGGDATGAARSTLQLRAQFQQATTLDLGAPGRSIGDEQVASGVLLDRAGKAVGTFGFTCTWVGVTRDNNLESCAGWGSLRDGQVLVAGMSRFRDERHTWAIVGGTGAYRSSRGEATIHDLSDTASDVILTFA